MEKLNNKYQNLLKVHTRLSRIMQKYSNPPAYADEEDIESYMTTLIKRFELTLELLWKLLKAHLKSQGIDTLGSKDVIRKSFTYHLLTEQEEKQLLDIIDVRNEIAHDYDEETAKELCNNVITHYFPLFSELLPRLENLTKK